MPIDAINFHEQAERDKNSSPVLLILDRATGKIYQAGAEGDSAILQVMSYVWDPDTLQPVKMEQPTINLDADDLTVTMGDVEKLLANNYWKDKRFENNSAGNPIYIGLNITHKELITATTWYILKFTWDASGRNLERIEGPLVGAWSNRTGLSWGP
jgi:hypothetical protein